MKLTLTTTALGMVYAADKGTGNGGTQVKDKVQDVPTVAPETSQAEKSIKDVYTSLKLRTDPLSNGMVLTVPKFGTETGETVEVVVPFEFRILWSQDGQSMFVHVPPTAGLFGVETDTDGITGLTMIGTDADALALLPTFRKERSDFSQSEAPPVPEELAKLLALVPAGYKLVMGKDGTSKLVRTRNRKPSTVVKTGQKSADYVDPALAGSLDD